VKRKLLHLWNIFFAPSPLRKKFLRAFLIVGLVPLLFMSTASFFLTNTIHRRDIAELEQTVARLTALEAKRDVDAILETIDVEVTGDDFSISQQQLVLGRLLERNPSLLELAFICNNPERCRFGHETTHLNQIHSVKTPDIIDYSEVPLFFTANGGNSYVGDLEFFAGQFTAQISRPVVNSDGDVVSVLAGRFTLDNLRDIIVDNRLGETGYVYIVNSDGVIIAHLNADIIGRHVGDFFSLHPAMEKDIVKGFATNKIYENFEGIQVSGLSTPIEMLDWNVVVEWPTHETQAVVTRFIWTGIQFTFGSLLLILFMGGFMASGLIRPIATLKQGVQAIGQGNFDYRFNLRTRDELQDLGSHLNAMAADLKSLQDLHDLQTRTKTLSESLRLEQELSNLKDQFVRTVSHQFNTPLSVIHWALEMINDPEASPDSVKEGLVTIDQSRKDILTMVDNLLTLSEIGFRYKKQNAKRVDFRKIVSAAVSKYHEEITGKHLTISFDESNETLLAEVNEFAMTKAVENLVSNAIEYSNENAHVEIVIDIQKENLTFSIKDFGIGIPEQEHGRIFEQFYRASNAIAKKNVGTGIGLFLAKTIIEGHGGKIWFESQQDAGATFYFSLPSNPATHVDKATKES